MQNTTTTNAARQPVNRWAVACDHCDSPIYCGEAYHSSQREFPFGLMPYVLCAHCDSALTDPETFTLPRGAVLDAIIARAMRRSREWGETVRALVRGVSHA